MEPQPVLAEAARVLRSGGIFAAYDYDVPPVIHPVLDAVFAEHTRIATSVVFLTTAIDREHLSDGSRFFGSSS